MTIMDTMRLVAYMCQVPLEDLTLVGSRRYGPDAPLLFTKDNSELEHDGRDLDIVVPWNGDMMVMRERIMRVMTTAHDHPNRTAYEDAMADDLNLVFELACPINLIIKSPDEAAMWRIAADSMDCIRAVDPAVWANKALRVACFRAFRVAAMKGVCHESNEARLRQQCNPTVS